MFVSLVAQLGVVPGPGLLFGLMLVAAIVGAYTARLVHIPRVVGFLLGGVALRAGLVAALGTSEGEPRWDQLEEAVEPLKVIKDLALGLILFTIGGVFESSRLRAAGRHIAKISAAEIVSVFGFVFAGCCIVVLLTDTGHDVVQKLLLVVLLAAAAVATAPAATLFVLQEFEAKGPVTDAILALTAVNNVVCIVLFHAIFLLLARAGLLDVSEALAGSAWLSLLSTTVGSVVLGVAGGTVISLLHAKLQISEMLLFFFALFILLGAGEQWLWRHVGVSFNFLLTAMVMGGVFANVAVDAQRLESTLRTFGSPIFAGFFVIAGFSLHVGDLAYMGVLGSAFVVCRFLGKTVGTAMGMRWAGGLAGAHGRLGPALLCQAAVVIGLASFVERNWQSDLAHRFVTVVLGSVVVFELVGPLLVKRCVVYAGEVKFITLLGRVPAATEGGSIFRLTLMALARLLGRGAARRITQSDKLRVKHIMRTNVQLIPASATFDEVLHAVERSTYSHFPVVRENGYFGGVIHFSDMRDVIYDPSLRALVTALDLADADTPPVPQDMPLRELLDVFAQYNVGALPVVDEADSRRIVGLVEQRDLLRALHSEQGRA